MAAISREGVAISYWASGDGFPVLFSHSAADTGRMWAPQVAALSSGYRVITWDLRGHGESDSPSDPAAYSAEASVGDMLAILDAEGARRAVLVGLSLGGYLSLAFRYTHPERVRALALCSTGPGYRNPAAREQYNASVEQRAAALDERGLESLGRSAEVVTQRGDQHSARGLALAARGIEKQQDSHIMDSLAEIDVPVLVMVGEKDRAFHGGTDYMAGKIPGARKVMIQNAGHTANLHQPDAFNAAILAFLSSIGLPPGGPAGG